MKVTLLDIYRKSNYKISKNTNSGMGTGNNYGNNIVGKIQNLLIKKSIHYPPQNCLYIMSILRDEGHEVIYSEALTENQSDLYIFTSSLVNFETELNSLIQLRELTNKPFIFIGSAAEFNYKKIISSDKKNNTFVIAGEAEGFFFENRKLINENFFLKFENKITYKKLYNLDEFPLPAWEIIFKYSSKSKMIFLGLNNKSITIEGSRGCPYSCSFYCCYPNIQGNKLRLRKPQKILDEMLYFNEKLNVKNFTFRDPVFSISKRHVVELLNKIILTNKKFNICVETQLKDMDEEMVQLMKKAGVKLIYVGVESSELEVLESAKRKNPSNENILEKVNYIEKSGIMIKCNYILGLPADNFNSSLKTIKFAEKINSVFAQFTIFTPMPNTPAWKLYEDKITSKKYEEFTMWDLIFDHKNLTKKDINKLKNYAAYYYLKPKYIFKNYPIIIKNLFVS